MLKKYLFLTLVVILFSTGCLSNLPGKPLEATPTAETAQAETNAEQQPTAIIEVSTLPEGPLVWTDASTTRELPAGSSYDSAWDYCSAVGTIDTPGSEYKGSNPPDAIKQSVLQAVNVSEKDGAGHNIVWRCVDGQVMGCDLTLNQHCLTQMNLSTLPNEALVNECKKPENDQAVMPAAVAGVDSPYEWICRNGAPVMSDQGVPVDEQGYNLLIWFPVPHP